MMRLPVCVLVAGLCLSRPATAQIARKCQSEERRIRAGDSLRAGTYRLTLVATEGTRRGASVSGTLVLRATSDSTRSPRTGQRAANSSHDEPLVGWTDVDFDAVATPVGGDTLVPPATSHDPVFPGVVVLRRGVGEEPFILLIGTLTNRRADKGWLDGTGIFLAPTHFGDRVAGEWAEWGIASNGRGHFCADFIGRRQ